MCASARNDDAIVDCMNDNNVCVRLRLVSMCVFRKRGARCTTEQTTKQRELVPARPDREAHKESTKEDAVCGRMSAECVENALDMVP